MRSAVPALIALAMPGLDAACTLAVEEQPGLRIERYTLQRIADYRTSTITGFLELHVAVPDKPNGLVLLLPGSQIAELQVNDRGTVVVYERLATAATVLRREVSVPEAVIKPEQVKALVNRSLPGGMGITR